MARSFDSGSFSSSSIFMLYCLFVDFEYECEKTRTPYHGLVNFLRMLLVNQGFRSRFSLRSSTKFYFMRMEVSCQISGELPSL